jgi:hypothetical protein
MLQLSTVSQVSFLPSSSHDPQFISCVATFYGGARKCCLTGVVDPGQGGQFEFNDRVIAAHIIRTAEPMLLLQINATHPNREFLTFQSPREAILLQKKWEILFDLHCWCLLPENPLSRDPVFTVHVFASAQTDTDKVKLSFLTSKKPPYPLEDWIQELTVYHGKQVTFDPNSKPSFRALSAHALQTVQFATVMRWIDDAQAAAFQIYGELSPIHSPPVSEAAVFEGAESP